MGTDDSSPRDVVNDIRLSVHARQDDEYGLMDAFVYVNEEIVFFREDVPVEAYPAGLRDFANHTVRKFAQRLAVLLDPGQGRPY